MSFQAPSFTTPVDQPYKICVQVDEEEVPGRSPEDSWTKRFTTVWLSYAHPLFSAGTAYAPIAFNSHTGGIPLRKLSSNNTTAFLAHALGESLYAEQFEVIWQFERFARGISSPGINDTAILTLDETEEEAPCRLNSEYYISEVHYLGWKEEHFRKFLDEYIRFSHLQTQDCVKQYDSARWASLQMPKWLSRAEISPVIRPPASAYGRILQDITPAPEKGSAVDEAAGVVDNEREQQHEQGSGSDADVEDECDDDDEEVEADVQ